MQASRWFESILLLIDYKECKINRQEIFKKYFLYTEESGSFIKWKALPAEKANVKVGEDAGWLCASDYWNVQLFGKCYKVHRVIYEMHFGEIPEGYSIDHINGDRQDNRISNLRVVTHRENNRNQGMYKNNNTGITGVTFWEDSLGRGGYRATVYLETGKKKTKYFSCLKHGKSDAFRLASEWRVRMLEELNQNNAGYTERHGL